VLMRVHPDEVYHLAAQSFVSYSFEDEFSTINTNINGTHHVLSCVREVSPGARFYFAGSSEMFGESSVSPQNEKTPLQPRSAYGISKVAGYHLTRNYREAYNLHASSGILFNHESPRRGNEFVTRKISSHVARIKLGLTDRINLGTLDARRDWGHAKDYVVAMWTMLQRDDPDDYVIASGETHSVQEFLEVAFDYVGLKHENYVIQDPALLRPAEISLLQGDAAKAAKQLGWKYERTFTSLVEEMVQYDLRRYRGEVRD
jgi:GDPmannose 4,6-dehydratase